MAGLDPTHLKAFLPAITDITARLKARWTRAAQDGREIDLLADLMRYTVDVTTGLAFGRSLDTLGQDEGGEVIQQHLNAIFPAMLRRTMAPFDMEHWLPPRAIRRHVAALQAAVQGFIRDSRERLRQQPQLAQRPQNLLQAMVLACDRDDAQVRLTDEELSGNVLTMLVAGEDTTANTLGWLIWLLHGHPAQWARARAEVEAAVGPSGLVQSLEQLAALDFVEACTHEAMRLKPVAPLIFLYAQQDAVVGDVAVPRGAFVACLMRPAGLLEQQFVAPQAFDPARWMAGGHAAQEGGVLSAKRTVMPFGGGPRVCPGRYLALAEIKMVMAMLLAGFDIRAMTTPAGGPHEKMSFVMSPEGLSVRLALRA